MRILAISVLLVAQAAPAFDVASVKPNPGGAGGRAVRSEPGGRLRITNASLRMVMSWAYGVQDSQLAGGPEWVGSERFDFLAKADGNPTTAEMRVMLRSLLVARFKLALHDETRELPVYAADPVAPRWPARSPSHPLGQQLCGDA